MDEKAVEKHELTRIAAAIDVTPSPRFIERLKQEGCRFEWIEGHIYFIDFPRGTTTEEALMPPTGWEDARIITFPSGWQIQSRWYRPETVALRWYPGFCQGMYPTPADFSV